MSTLVKRLLIALGAGIVAFNLTAIAAWEMGRSSIDAAARDRTAAHFSYLSRQLDGYRENHHRLPNDLAEANQFSRPEELQDGWGNPIVYEPHGKTYTLRSLGADGKPGGEGIDADTTYKDKAEKAHSVTLSQFLWSPKLGGARQDYLTCCLVHGGLWFFIVATSSKGLEASLANRVWTIIGMLLVFCITLLGATIQLSLELVPSGH